MKKVALILSHTGSGSGDLCNILDANPRVQVYRTGTVYNHPTLVESISQQPHKANNAAGVFVDELLSNILFTSKALYQCCKFIYVVRSALPTLIAITESKATLAQNVRYYTYRLCRIYEMARKTPGAVLLTWEDMTAGRFGPLESYLNLKEKLAGHEKLFPNPPIKSFITGTLVNEAQDAYERYLYLLRNLPLKKFEFERNDGSGIIS